MPRDFNLCVAQGGRVRTKKLSKGRFIRICFDKNNKSHAGEVKQRQKSK